MWLCAWHAHHICCVCVSVFFCALFVFLMFLSNLWFFCWFWPCVFVFSCPLNLIPSRMKINCRTIFNRTMTTPFPRVLEMSVNTGIPFVVLYNRYGSSSNQNSAVTPDGDASLMFPGTVHGSLLIAVHLSFQQNFLSDSANFCQLARSDKCFRPRNCLSLFKFLLFVFFVYFLFAFDLSRFSLYPEISHKCPKSRYLQGNRISNPSFFYLWWISVVCLAWN